jgi:hypothetical protein
VLSIYIQQANTNFPSHQADPVLHRQSERLVEMKKLLDEALRDFHTLPPADQLSLSKYLRQTSFALEVPLFVAKQSEGQSSTVLPNLRRVRKFGREKQQESKISRDEALAIVGGVIGFN